MALPVLAISLLLPPGTALAAQLERVQTGEVTMNATTRTATLASAVDPAKSFVVCSARTNGHQPSRRPSCELGSGSSTTTVTIAAGTADPTTVVRWYVAEFASGVSVRRGTSTFVGAATTPANAPAFAAVTVGRSFVLLGERTDSTDKGTDEQWSVRARLAGTQASTMELTRLAGGKSGSTLTVAWQVIEIDSATVQRGTVCIGGSATCPGSNGATVSATLGTPVDTGRSFVVITKRGGQAIDGVDSLLAVRADFASTGTNVSGLKFTRAVAATAADQQVDISYEVVSLGDDALVTRGVAAASGSLKHLTANPNAMVAQSFPLITASGGSTKLTNELDDVSWTAFISSNTVIEFDRVGSNQPPDSSVSWQVVQFQKCGAVTDVTDLSGVGTSVNGVARLEYAPRSVLILRKRQPFTDGEAPANGVQYAVGAAVGGATVVKSDQVPSTVFEEAGLGASTTVYYRVFARSGLCYAPGGTETEVSIRTSGGSTAWVYSNTSGVTLNAPVASVGAVGVDTALTTTTGGKIIAADIETGIQRYFPARTSAGIQTYAIGLPLSGSDVEKLFVGDESGRVYRIDVATGAIDWTAGPFPGVDGIRAAITVQQYDTAAWFSGGDAFRNAPFQRPTPTDVVFVASHNGVGTCGNRVLALRADTGAVIWTFNGGQFGMDVVAGQPWIDYETNALYVVSRDGGGFGKSYWVLDSITGTLRTARSYGNFVGAAVSMGYDADTMVADTVYAGNATGQVLAIDPADHHVRWFFHAGMWNAIKGSVAEDWNTGFLYFTTADGHVWCVDGNGRKVWKTTTPVPGVSTALTLPTDWGDAIAGVYVGSSDGTLRRFTLDGRGTGTATLASRALVVGDPAVDKTLGEPTTFDGTALLIGSDEGKVYKITLPLP